LIQPKPAPVSPVAVLVMIRDWKSVLMRSLAAPSGLESASLSVTVYESPSEARAAFKKAIETNGYRALSSPGQGAYTSPMYDLTVLSGRYELAADVNVMQDDQTPVARKLAQQAVARLPR